MNDFSVEKEKIKEKMFESIFEYAGACHAENIVGEMNTKIKSGKQIFIPQELDVRMKKLIFRHYMKQNIRQVGKISAKVFPKVAVLFFIIFISFAILVTSVEAFRIKVFNFIIEVEKEYTSIDLNNSSNTIPKEISEIPQEWGNVYVPAYIPEGFKITKTESLMLTTMIYYSNAEGQLIIFQQRSGENVNMRFDTENTVSENITVNGLEGLLVEKSRRTTLIWHNNDLLFSIMTEDVDKNILILMAESLEVK